jgi:orotidine-5'-phosphate decarboxylase
VHPYLEKLQLDAGLKGSVLCFGMDPVVERMKLDHSENLGDQVESYYRRILDCIHEQVSAVKPNLGYFLQYGGDGLRALGNLVRYARGRDLPVILDGKFGDIGRTASAYAWFAFSEIGADAVTLNPYMGRDALEPFFGCSDKGHYVLALTSNPGSRDFQTEMMKPGIALYEYVLKTVCCWHAKCPAVGCVIGATQSGLGSIIEQLVAQQCEMPLLIPGVGAQGGSYSEVTALLVEKGYKSGLVRVNASSSIAFAHESRPGTVEEAAYSVVKEMLE